MIKSKTYENCVVYVHKRVSDGLVFYVGIATNMKRPYQKGRGNFWNMYTKKYEYEVEILHTNLTWEIACKFEQELIKKYGRRDKNEGHLVNMTDGGEGTLGVIVTEERRQKYRSNMLINNPMNDEESRKKVSLSKIGIPRPDLSERNSTPEHIEKCQAGRKKWLESEEATWYYEFASKKMSGNKNISHLPGVREKIKSGLVKYNASLTLDQKYEKLSKSVNKRVVCIYCNIETNTGNHGRWHGEKCKNKKI